MDSELVGLGLKHGLIDGSRLTHLEACFDVQPALGDFILTDPKFRHPSESDQSGVYYLGSDSYALVNTVPRDQVDSALDIFTGSGVHAVLAANHAKSVVGVDINPRAVAMGKANAALNRKSDICRFVEGDLFAPVDGQKFDLITANPPFVPTPDQDLALYRSGGESGELLTGQVLQQLHNFLNPGGVMAMVTNYPVFKDVDIVDHHRSLLGAPEKFGIALLHSYTFPREMYIQMHLAPSGNPERDQKARNRWLASYHRQRIVGMGFGVLFFCHLANGKPWSASKDNLDLVHRPLSDDVSRWLGGLCRFGSGVEHPTQLKFHPQSKIYRELRKGGGVLAWDSDWPALELDSEEMNQVAQWLESESFSSVGSDDLVGKLGREGALLAAD